MVRRVIACGILVVLATPVGGTTEASAQRLFNRIRARVESRIPASPPAPPTPQSQTPRQNLGPSALSPTNSRSTASSNSPTFGIDVTPVRTGRYPGLQVIGFQPNSRAAQAGIRLGDVIVSIQGQRTLRISDVSRALANSSAGQQAVLRLARGTRLFQATVPVIVGDDESEATADSESDASSANRPNSNGRSRLTAKPPINSATGPTLARPRASLGLEVRDASPQRGIEVVIVPAGTAGMIGGLKPGDRIVSVEGRLVKDLDDMIRELSLTNPGESVGFGVVRGESMLEFDIALGGPGGTPIREATEQRAKELSQDFADSDAGTPQSSGAATGSILGDMGSALGGFFSGGDSATKTKDPLALPEDDSPNATGSADVLPTPEPEPESVDSEVQRLRAEVERLKRQLDEQ